MTFATAATLMTFTLEWSLRRWIRTSHRLSLATAPGAGCVGAALSPKNEEENALKAADLAERAETMENMVIAYTFEAGIIFHSEPSFSTLLKLDRVFCNTQVEFQIIIIRSADACDEWVACKVCTNACQVMALQFKRVCIRIRRGALLKLTVQRPINGIIAGIFVGITLGIASSQTSIVALMVALTFHQGNEGLALGVLFVKARYPPLKYFLLAAVFVVITPTGTAIGIALGQKYNGSSKAALGSEGVFDSISAGILIYNGLVDLVVPTFSDKELPEGWKMSLAGFAALYSGAAIMALIGKWV